LLTYIFSLILGFFVGSLPTTYLLVKWRKKLDIREQGTGNVGTMNVYEVTNSRPLGIAVLLLDVLKAVAALYLARFLLGGHEVFGSDFWIMAAAGVGAMFGHIYSPWIGFRGGRGLATTLGVSLVLGWVIAAAWFIGYLVTYAIRHDIHISSLTATVFMPVILALAPGDVIGSLTGSLPGDIRIFSIVLAVLILLGHTGVIMQLIKSSTTNTITLE